MALKHPETFSRAAALDGVLDLEAVIQKALRGEDTGIPHDKASLEAVFGDLETFPGSANDLFSLAEKKVEGRVLFVWEDGSPRAAENLRLAKKLGETAETAVLTAGADLHACQSSLPAALAWMMKEARA